jgi:thioredoxin reductase
VTAISREGFDKVKTKGREASPFVVRYTDASGDVQEVKARAIIDASGTWSQPNPLGANGLPAIGEVENRARISYGIPDVLGAERPRYSGRRVMVVGAGHSAANSLLSLAELAKQNPETRLVWTVRGANLTRVFGGGAVDALPARGELGTALRKLQVSGGLEMVHEFRIVRIERAGEQLTVVGLDTRGKESRIDGVDEIICATGQRPDYSIASELRLKLDPWLESSEALGPLIDPNEHSCGTVRPHGHRELAHPEPGFYTAGVKSYGRAATFLLATGFEQVRSIAAALAGDFEAADRVELDLPETGVCGIGGDVIAGGSCCGATPKAAPAAVPEAASSCCGGPVPKGVDACCVKDADAKASGEAGCGCSTAAKPKEAPKEELVGSACCG